MPLFLCPNDNDEMQKVKRDNVELDICPTCRGIWLDRGELEKLLTVQKDEQAVQEQAEAKFRQERDAFHRDPRTWEKQHPWDENRQRHRYDDDDDDDRRRHGKKRRGGFDFFDIFD